MPLLGSAPYHLRPQASCPSSPELSFIVHYKGGDATRVVGLLGGLNKIFIKLSGTGLVLTHTRGARGKGGEKAGMVPSELHQLIHT